MTNMVHFCFRRSGSDDTEHRSGSKQPSFEGHHAWIAKYRHVPVRSRLTEGNLAVPVLLRWQRNWRQRRSWRGPCISGGRRRWRGVTGTDLHWPPGVADDTAIRIKDRLGRPIATGPIDRLGIAWIDHIAGGSRGKDRAGHDRATDHTGSNTCADARAAPATTSAPAPSTSSPLRRGIGCRDR